MKYKRLTAHYAGSECEMAAGKLEVGACRYGFLPGGTRYNYLLNTLLACQEAAREKFDVSVSCWRAAFPFFV